MSYFKSAVSSERCCVREGALRINWDASHPLGSVGGWEAVEGQSSNMQSGLLKGKFGLNCSSSILCWLPSAATRRWRVEKKSNVTQQLRFLSESPDIWDLNHIFRAYSINYQGHINIFTLELLYATDGWGICMKFKSCRNWQKIKYCFSLKYNQHQWTHQVWTTKALKVFFNRLITPSVKKPGRLLRGHA